MHTINVGRVFIHVLLFCIVVLSGCGTAHVYSGEERPASETAIIKGSGVFPFKNVFITGVDGKSLGLKNSRAAVLPGEHRLTVHISQSYGVVELSANGTITFTAVAGREYVVYGSVKVRKKAKFWIEDTTTSEVVGGEKPN